MSTAGTVAGEAGQPQTDRRTVVGCNLFAAEAWGGYGEIEQGRYAQRRVPDESSQTHLCDVQDPRSTSMMKQL